MDEIEKAYESVASGSPFGAMHRLAGDSRTKQQVFRQALRLASNFDDDDWRTVKGWLAEQPKP